MIYFLQSDPNIPSSVTQLSETSIKLAEAAANFGALKLMFGVFITFIFIIMVYFIFQMMSYNKKVSDIHGTSKKVEGFFNNVNSKTIGKVQATALIRRTFLTFSQTMKYYILRFRLEKKGPRGAGGKEAMTTRIINLINYEVSELVSFLNSFEYEGRQVYEGMSSEDLQLLTDFIIEQSFIEQESFSVSGMDQATDILISGIKLTALKGLD